MSTDPFGRKAEWFDRHYESVRGRVRFRVLRAQLQEALAADGYAVTLLEPSEKMRERAAIVLSKGKKLLSVPRSRVPNGVTSTPRIVRLLNLYLLTL